MDRQVESAGEIERENGMMMMEEKHRETEIWSCEKRSGSEMETKR